MGESRDDVLRKVGNPNAVKTVDGGVVYYYFTGGYSARGLDIPHLNICSRKIADDASRYEVTFDSSGKVHSVLFWKGEGTTSERVTVPGEDGLALPAILYRSRECEVRRRPALILLHGWQDDETPAETALKLPAQWFAERGYVVLTPVMRGWGAGVNDCGLTQPADTIRAIDWLGAQPGVDPDRIGLIGFSFGGQVALLAGGRSRRIKAIVSYAGPTDLAELKAISPGKWYGKELCEPDLKRRSPISVAGSISAPVLLVQEDADPAVPVAQAVQMDEAMLRSGKDARLIIERSDGHVTDWALIDSWSDVGRFLDKTLGNPACTTSFPTPSASSAVERIAAQTENR